MAVGEKDPAIVRVVERLRADLGAGYFVEVPYWEADLLAVGLGRPDDPDVLVYVAVGMDDDGFHVECETPVVAGEEELPYRLAWRGENVSYDEVREAVRRHLAPLTADC